MTKRYHKDLQQMIMQRDCVFIVSAKHFNNYRN